VLTVKFRGKRGTNDTKSGKVRFFISCGIVKKICDKGTVGSAVGRLCWSSQRTTGKHHKGRALTRCRLALVGSSIPIYEGLELDTGSGEDSRDERSGKVWRR
jgi:hypothetical protein